MIVQLNTSVPSAGAAKEDTASPFQASPLQEGAVLPETLSLAERETYNLALDAQNGDNVLDKVILNVVRPPALVLFALLDAGRVFPDVPLPQAQDAYDRMAETTETALPDVGDSSKNQPGAKSAKTDSGFAASGSNATSSPIAAGTSSASSTISTSAPSINA
ncbi:MULTISPECIES: hypothetical protein [Rhizobium/Agrobacterium group]|uniref:hypothetical protein n=1 Tax=Rhizobium/Agrobacterium group TaxID=227290 RepID=UPI000B3FE07B|nr:MULTISPECIES: hypothetical protein [Rhizobium/Agrobacterium group]MCF1483365.1 hypothetical protein [Allorhizobium ampelinum]NSZ41548.1 hypothetical protein [Agrobacterium vitis]NTA25231.1 hypothetical protein [Allorhizobium ampelinum]OVE98071.1 hypothetical protein B7W85_01790 [Allorhizobium ampelinum]